jgi:hypothetical protein
LSRMTCDRVPIQPRDWLNQSHWAVIRGLGTIDSN